jgi:translation initiation factor IF-3
MNTPPFNRFQNRFQKKDDGKYKINERILAKTIRLIREGEEPLVCDTSEALHQAKELGLDLVEVSPDSDPPVCKIIDYKKFLYDKKKKDRDNKNKGASVMKEMQLSPNIGEHDYMFKAKQVIEFLNKGHKVKISILFKGRTIVYKDKGEMLMLKFSQEIGDAGRVEQLPKQEGKFMTMMMIPKKK